MRDEQEVLSACALHGIAGLQNFDRHASRIAVEIVAHFERVREADPAFEGPGRENSPCARWPGRFFSVVRIAFTQP